MKITGLRRKKRKNTSEGGRRKNLGRKGWTGIEVYAYFSLLVSHGFVFMNGFAVVALREIVLFSLPMASILSFHPYLRITGYRTASSIGGLMSHYYSQNGRRLRIDISHSARHRPQLFSRELNSECC